MEVNENDIEIILSEPQTAVLETRKAQILNMAGQGGGKSRVIGYSSGMFVTDFPMVKGFIGANTEMQLTQSTLAAVFKSWAETYGYEEYDPKNNPAGAYVVDKKPPLHFTKYHKFRRYGGIVSFYNGATIFLGSLENYKAHDGKEFGWAHLDETKDTKEAALEEVIVARLRQYGLWYDQEGAIHFDDEVNEEESMARGWTAWNPLYIHTSPALGGVDWLNKKFQLPAYATEIKKKVLRKDKDYFHREFGNMCVVISSAYHNRYNLPPNYLGNQEASLRTEEKILKMVHGYPFSKSGGEWIPSFRRDWHVKSVPYIPGDPVHQTWDFNVVPYMTLLCSQVQYLTRYIDEAGIKKDSPTIGDKPIEVMRIRIYREYCVEPPANSVDGCCERFKSDHPPGTVEVNLYGDASGLSRIPGLGGNYTNFGQIKKTLFEYVHNQSTKVKAPNVGVFKRRDLLDDIFAGKFPEVEIEIDESCEKTINDLEHVKTGNNGKIKEKEEDPNTGKRFEKNGHALDALEYLVCKICEHYMK